MGVRRAGLARGARPRAAASPTRTPTSSPSSWPAPARRSWAARCSAAATGPWESDPNANGWWGDDPPFHHHVFVLTHHAREPLTLSDTTFHFVTDGIESALEQARAAAGEKDVVVAGGAEAGRQYLAAGLLDEMQIHVAPILLGGGTRLFDDASGELELVRTIASPAVTHLRYRVVK